MEAGAGAQIRPDVVVAGEAALALRGGVEGIVALAALALDLRVAFDHRPRHHELLEIDGARGAREQEHERCDDRACAMHDLSTC